jgi:hypothetical protein
VVPTCHPSPSNPTRAILESEHLLDSRACALTTPLGLPGLALARLPVTFVGRLTYQLTFPLYLAASRAPPSSPTPSSRTHDQLGPSHVTPHLPGSLAHMLARVRAYQLRAPNRVASSSSTCERCTSGPLSPLANTPRSHLPVRCAGARAACTRALHRAARPSCLLPRAHDPGHFQHVAAPDDRTRANPQVVAISACTPNHPPAPLDRSSAHTEVPILCLSASPMPPCAATHGRLSSPPRLFSPTRKGTTTITLTFKPPLMASLSVLPSSCTHA